MSEFKGTPGPWVIDTDSSDYGNSWWYTVGPAQVGGGRHGEECVEATADAHLISAALELLESLVGLKAAYSKPDEQLCCNGMDCGCCGSTTRQLAEHYADLAIAKALGDAA